MNREPITTVIRDDIPVPQRPKRGIKPLNDDRFVEIGLKGIESGKYKDREQAAYQIALSVFTDYMHKDFGAFRRRLNRKLKRPNFLG